MLTNYFKILDYSKRNICHSLFGKKDIELNYNLQNGGVDTMLSNIGVPGLIIILVIALIVFGPKKLPEMGRAVGQTLKEFKKSTRELVEDEKETVQEIIESDKKEINKTNS